MKWIAIVLMTALLAAGGCKGGGSTNEDAPKQRELLNVSYDPTRELYTEVNRAFVAHWKKKTGEDVKIQMSHGGSGKQARAVIDGLEADVVTLAVPYDVDQMVEQGKLLPPEWQSRLSHNGAPYTSTIVFLVRKGNPRQIRDWDDLTRDGVKVITPNPKTSGGARYNYLAAWGYALQKNAGDEGKAREFVASLYRNVPVLDSGARGATTTFVERRIGDVLITWENEALLASEKLKGAGVEVVLPSISVLAEPPVAVVDRYAEKHGTKDVATAYLEFLYTPEGQKFAAKHHYRPRDASAAAGFPRLKVFTVGEVFGSFTEAQKKHFADGGEFDRLYQPGRR